MKSRDASDGSKSPRWAGTGLFSGLFMISLASACSSPLPPCDPPIEPGAEYRVTVLRETPESNACHIVKLEPSFRITAAFRESLGGPSCTMTPAEWAPDPEQKGVMVIDCEPSHQMLGTECQMLYPSRCQGFINFYFYAPQNSAVDWSAPTIHGARFRVKDHVAGCIPDQANCLDEYDVQLDRM